MQSARVDCVVHGESVDHLHGTVHSRPTRPELERLIGILLDRVKDYDAVYMAWSVLNDAYNKG